MTLQCILKSGSVMSSVLFFLKITLAILKFLLFRMNFRVGFSPLFLLKKKKCLWDFIGASIELVDWFGL